jgi:hypothetical protein
MADAKKSKPRSAWQDVWWLLGILAAFFVLWIIGGGPERAAKSNVGPIINGSIQNTSQSSTTTKTTITNTQPTSGDIKVTPIN